MVKNRELQIQSEIIKLLLRDSGGRTGSLCMWTKPIWNHAAKGAGRDEFRCHNHGYAYCRFFASGLNKFVLYADT